MHSCECESECVCERAQGKENKENWSFQQPAFPERFETTLKVAVFRQRKFVQTEPEVGGEQTRFQVIALIIRVCQNFWFSL